MPSSFAIGWSPVSRSMIASLRAASPIPESTKMPAESGPRWTSDALIAASASRSTGPRDDAIPQIPHTGAYSRDTSPRDSPLSGIAPDARVAHGAQADVRQRPLRLHETRSQHARVRGRDGVLHVGRVRDLRAQPARARAPAHPRLATGEGCP